MATSPPSSDHPAAVRVFLRPIGSPLTIGMSGLAVASLVQSGFDLRWVAPSQRPEVGVLLVAIPFVLQMIACIFAYLSRDGAAGAAVGLLSASWLGMGLSYITSTPPSRSGALGLMLLASGGVLLCSALAVMLSKPLPGVVFALAGVRFVLSGIYELDGSSSWHHAAGVIGLVVCGLAVYCVLAFELEGERHRPVLPTFRRGTGRSALARGLDGQLDGVANEAGVRQTT